MGEGGLNRFGRGLSLFVILFAAWLLMSGHYTPLLVSLGIASCALATLLAHLIGASDDEGLPLHMFARLPSYLLWLLREIITANLATARIILSGSARPVLFKTIATQTTAAGVATYANSITLTPGTVTIEMNPADEDSAVLEGIQPTSHVFLVHALDPVFEEDVANGEMDRRVSALEGETP